MSAATVELAKRNEYEARRRGRLPRCRGCRLGNGAPDPALVARMRKAWLSRYSLEELQAWPSL